MAYIDMELNAQNMTSPQPMVQTLRAMDQLSAGQVLKVTTTEPRSIPNFEAMCAQLGHKIMQIIDWDGEYTFLLQKV
ncbi:hypothetical protein MNBD_GAMMA21-2106 [hydrothermal vent metagenome]|uniref:UPF0033 domain-containing protein n=1 Tax=hydrothermal vent metagenome TaxID=652676 RepID=A0A3B0ZUS3_9ZZZZ